MKRIALRNVARAAVVIVAATTPAVAAPKPPDYDISGFDGLGYFSIEGSILPYGSFHTQVGNFAQDSSADVAYGLCVSYMDQLTPNLSLGFAPRVLFDVESQDEAFVEKQLDLRARFRAGAVVYRQFRLFAELTAGYSFVFLPASAGQPNPNGFILGGGGGVSYGLAKWTAIVLSLNYQNGFQQFSKNNIGVQESDDFFEISLGITRALF